MGSLMVMEKNRKVSPTVVEIVEVVEVVEARGGLELKETVT